MERKAAARVRQKLLERRVIGQRSRFAQQLGRFLQIRAILLAVGDRVQLAIGIAMNHGEKTFGLLALGFRKRLHPSFELLARHVLGIEIRARQLLRRNAGQKCVVIVDLGPGRFVQPEIIQARLAQWRGVLPQLGVERVVAAPHLGEEDIVQYARGFNQLPERLTVARRELGKVHAQLGGLEAHDHFLKLREIGNSGSGGKHSDKTRNLFTIRMLPR